MLISGCEILAPKLLLHSQASVRKHHCFFFKRIFFFCFFFFFGSVSVFAQIYTGVKEGREVKGKDEGEEAPLCPKR